MMKYFFSSFFLLFLLSPFAYSFDQNEVYLAARGASGMSANNGIDYDYSRARDGNDSYMGGFAGGDGADGMNGGDASMAFDGRNGGSIVLKLRAHPTKPNFALYSSVVDGQTTPEQEILVTNTTKFILDASGGNGGNGGSGGGGQSGGNGGRGGNAERFHNSAGNGGRGGRGGNSGRSTNGANGGNGGNIQVLLHAGDDVLLSHVQYNVNGGRGGLAPVRQPRPGNGGSGGQPGDNCYYDQGERKCGIFGQYGQAGMSGSPSYNYPTAGLTGLMGTFEVKSF